MIAEPSPVPVPDAGTSFARQAAAPFALTLGMLAYHFGLWLRVGERRGIPITEMLLHADGAHYARIATHGYEGALWAFFPLYPLTVKGLLWLVGPSVPAQVIGAALSTLALLLFVASVVALKRSTVAADRIAGLAPANLWGWFLFLFSPGSFALHSNHTEGLFLLASFWAFSMARVRRPALAGVAAGLSLLTRNQGALVTLSTALLALGQRPLRLRDSLTLLAVAGLFLAGLLAFETWGTGNPLAFASAEQHWPHVHSAWEALRTLWMGNPWQLSNPLILAHQVFAVVLTAASILCWRRQPALGFYGLSSVGVMLLQGEFGNAFRFGSVLFPLAFTSGDWLASQRRWVSLPLAAALVVANHWLTLHYAVGGWAY